MELFINFKGVVLKLKFKKGSLYLQFFIWSVISLFFIASIQMALVLFSHWQLSHKISTTFSKSLEEANEDYLKNFIRMTSKRIESYFKKADHELEILSYNAQFYFDHRHLYLEILNTKSGRKLFGDQLKYDRNNHWWQNQSDEMSLVIGYSHILDHQHRIPKMTREHILITGVLDPLFASLMERGIPKQRVYFIGPEGKSYVRVYPWQDLIAVPDQKYPGQKQVDIWKFYFPELLDHFKNRLSDPQKNQKALSQVVWTPPIDDIGSSDYKISLFTPIWNLSRTQFEGAFAIDLNLNHIVEFIEKIVVEETGFAFLISDDGHVVAASDRAQDIMGLKSRLSKLNPQGIKSIIYDIQDSEFSSIRKIQNLLGQRAIMKKMILKHSKGDNEYYSLALEPLEPMWLLNNGYVKKAKWSIGILVPDEEILKPLMSTQTVLKDSNENIFIQYGLVLLMVIAVAIIISSILAHKLSSRIRKLVHVAEDMAHHEYNVRVNIKGNDEISQLSTAFNQMAEKIDFHQKSLIESEKRAVAANKAKSVFLATMSHEMRTPLNALAGVMQLLKETPLNTEQKKYLTIYERASAALKTIVDDALDLSSIESGEFKIKSVVFNPVETFESTFQLIAKQALEKKLKYEIDLDPLLPKKLKGDHDRISQIILNLLSNAIKFTEEGQVSLAVRVLHTDGNHEQIKLEIVVSDSGIGISEDNLETIFDKFQQVHDFIDRKYSGTGLGLAITKRLVSVMGGKISVQSTPGKGSTFACEIPFTTYKECPENKRENDLGTATRQLQKHKILLVEDSPDNRLLIQLFLKNEPYEIINAENGQVAFDLFKQEDFDLVLMDLQMPVMNGFTATQMIREYEEAHHKKHTPIIALTAHANPEVVEKIITCGANLHLSKPLDLKKLIQTLRSAVEI